MESQAVFLMKMGSWNQNIGFANPAKFPVSESRVKRPGTIPLFSLLISFQSVIPDMSQPIPTYFPFRCKLHFTTNLLLFGKIWNFESFLYTNISSYTPLTLPAKQIFFWVFGTG